MVDDVISNISVLLLATDGDTKLERRLSEERVLLNTVDVAYILLSLIGTRISFEDKLRCKLMLIH